MGNKGGLKYHLFVETPGLEWLKDSCRPSVGVATIGAMGREPGAGSRRPAAGGDVEFGRGKGGGGKGAGSDSGWRRGLTVSRFPSDPAFLL